MHNTSTEYKQMHNKNKIMGRILLYPSASSSSSFMTSSFIIQIFKMDKRFSKNWVLHIPHRLRDLLSMVRAWSLVAPIFSSLNMSRAYSSSQSLLKVITSFWHIFLEWMNPMILGGHSRRLSPLLHSPLLLLSLQVVLHSGSSHSSTVFSKPSSDLSSYLQIAWSRNQTSSVYLGKTLVVQVDSWLNQQWSSCPWPGSCVRLLASSPSRTGTSLLIYVSNSFSSERSYTSMLGICQLHQAYHQADVIDHFEMRTSNENRKRLDLTDLRCPS